jgi:plasmid maintenance system antidote protein VapI
MTLQEFMSRRGLTDEMAASALGVSRPHVTRLRSGERGASLALAAKILTWSGGDVPIEELCPEAAGLIRQLAAGAAA